MAENLKWLPSDSDCSKLIRKNNWNDQIIGPPQSWPQCLKTTVSLILSSRFPMFLWWGEERTNIYNDAYAEIAGPTKHPKFFGCPANQMWSEIWETVGPLADKVITTGESLKFENLPLTVNRKGKNDEAYFTFSYSPVFDIDGSIQGLLGVVQETTDQIISQEETEFERRKLTDFFMNSPVAFARVRGPDHIFDMVNKTYLELIDYRDVLGHPVKEALPELKEQGFFQLLDQVYQKGERYVSLESKVVLKQNESEKVKYLSFIYEPEKNARGEVVGIIAMANDITSVVNARLEVEATSKTLSVVHRVGQQLSSILDIKTLVQAITDAGVEICGAQFGAFFYNSVDAEGKELLLYTVSGVPEEAFNKFPNPRPTAVFHPTFIGAGTVRSDDITKDPNYGKNQPYGGIPEGHLPVKSYLAVSVISRSGEVIGGLFFGHEDPGIFTLQHEQIIEGLASQTAIAMDNARLYENLQKSLNSRDQFISIASHELKTPLTTLTLQSQIRNRLIQKLSSEQQEKNKLLRLIETDDKQLKRLTRLIDDMLDISRIQTGKLTLNSVRIDFTQVVEEIVERFRPQFKEKDIDLSFVGPEQAFVNADVFRIEQVVVNLLNNALKYGNKRPVNVKVEKADKEAILEVKDQGIGIKSEDHNRIFKRFERAVSQDEISGLGIGLSISKEIIEAHGGFISVTSEPGSGSIFKVILPLS